MRRLRSLAYVTLLLLLAGCQLGSYTRPHGPFFYEQVRANASKVVLHKALTIPAQQVRVYIQGGRPVSNREVYIQEALCEFEVRNLEQTAIEIKPDEFTINRVVHSEDLFSHLQPPYMLASASAGGDGAADLYRFYTRLSVSSPRQPNVMFFTCSHMDHVTAGGDHLRYNQYLSTVGDIVSLAR